MSFQMTTMMMEHRRLYSTPHGLKYGLTLLMRGVIMSDTLQVHTWLIFSVMTFDTFKVIFDIKFSLVTFVNCS